MNFEKAIFYEKKMSRDWDSNSGSSYVYIHLLMFLIICASCIF